MSDDLFDDFEPLDDGANPLADADNTALMAALGRFTAQVDEKIKILRAPKRYSTAERREAALWLGDSGDARAIPALLLVYRKDSKNRDVQQAAAYALGQFKALDKAIKRGKDETVESALSQPKNEHIFDLLTDIAINGRRGKKGGCGKWLFFTLLLLLTLAGLIAAIVYLPDYLAGRAEQRYAERFASLTGHPAQLAVAQLEILNADLAADADALQQQLALNTLNCEFAFNRPIAFAPPESVTAALDGLSAAAADYNAARDRWLAAHAPFDAACRAATADAPAEVPPTERIAARAAATETGGAVVAIAAQIDALKIGADALAQRASEQATATAEFFATATQRTLITPTPTITLTPTPGIALDQINRQIGLLLTRLGDAQGVTNVLETYWTDFRDSGVTQGCISGAPSIPEDYVLPEEFAAFEPDIQTAVNLINTGLQLSRDSFGTFQRACAAGTLAASVDAGLESIAAIRSSYIVAEQLLDERARR
jgi:hypothetical protein